MTLLYIPPSQSAFLAWCSSGGQLSRADAEMRRRTLVTQVGGQVAGWRRALSALRVLLAEVTPRISSRTFLPPALPQYYRQTGPAKVKEVLAHIQSLLEAGE